MSMYTVGSVTVQVGSSRVVGSSTDFTNNVSAGDLFKLRLSPVFYDVAAINSATVITLSSRYANTNYYLNATNEALGTTNVGTTVYSGTLDNTPVIQNYVVINATNIRFTDDGAGVLTGTNADGTHTGSINYDTGLWALSFNATYNASLVMSGSYIYGDTLTSMSYQIVKDFTPNYSLPEMSLNDVNFQHLYTKCIRLLDSYIYELSASSLSASNDITVTGTPFGLVQKSPDGTSFRLKISNNGTVTASSI